jgi:hypothetical protein
VIADDRCVVDDPAWSAVLSAAPILRALPCVGALRSADFGPQTHLGTAWRVDHDIAATCAHVTRRLAARLACGAVAVTLDDRPVLAVLHQDDDHDLAFVRLAPEHPPAPTLALATCAVGDLVAAIGRPTRSVAHYDPIEIQRIFAGRFDVKRLAPGTITATHPHRVDHDCTTLGGSSGSPLIDLASGAAVGLHYGGEGRFLSNWAVPAAVVAARLASVRG